jgi:hypothetical protein
LEPIYNSHYELPALVDLQLTRAAKLGLQPQSNAAPRSASSYR